MLFFGEYVFVVLFSWWLIILVIIKKKGNKSEYSDCGGYHCSWNWIYWCTLVHLTNTRWCCGDFFLKKSILGSFQQKLDKKLVHWSKIGGVLCVYFEIQYKSLNQVKKRVQDFDFSFSGLSITFLLLHWFWFYKFWLFLVTEFFLLLWMIWLSNVT